MEPNLKKFKFNLYKNNCKQKTRFCNIRSCWHCQGKDPPSKEEIDKIKALNKMKKPKAFNPNSPEKYYPNKSCSYCRRIKYLNENKKSSII